MDKVSSYHIGFTGGRIKVKSSVKKYAPQQVRDAISETAENVAEMADRNGVIVTYSMRKNPKKVKADDGKCLYVKINRSNGLFRRLLSGSLKGYGEYRNPEITGNFEGPAFVANVREIISRYKNKSYAKETKRVRKHLA